MLKSELLAALRTEIHRHDFSHFVDEPPSIAQGGRGVVVPGTGLLDSDHTGGMLSWACNMRTSKGTTKIGFVNRNGQVVIRNTGLPGTDHNAKVYQLGCSHCGQVYGSNGTDIFDRKCPHHGCQKGERGLPLP